MLGCFHRNGNQEKKLPSIILLAAIGSRHICYGTIHFRSINKRSRRGMTHFKHQFQFWNFWNFNRYKSLPKEYELGSCCVGHTAVLSMPWPGFEPGLSRPQREVLTTIRSRPARSLATFTLFRSQSWITIIFKLLYYVLINMAPFGCEVKHLPLSMIHTNNNLNLLTL